MLALFIGLLGALVMMAGMMMVAIGIAGIFVSVPRLGGTWFGRPVWHWLAASIVNLLIGFAIYFATACAVGWTLMR